jgi:hypothetical protein
MEHREVEATPAEKWQASLNATCNRLITQYATLVKSAAGISTVSAKQPGNTSAAVTKSSMTSASTTTTTPAAATSTSTNSCSTKIDGRRGGGGMFLDAKQNPPPPALAADAALVSLQAQLASQNLAIATSNLLDLIRTLRMSALLMDEGVIQEEEQAEYEICIEEARSIAKETANLEKELFQLLYYGKE